MNLYRKIKYYLLMVIFCIACQEDGLEQFVVSPGNWETSPLVFIEAEDSENNWVQGVIEGKSVSFTFRTLSSLKNVKMRYGLESGCSLSGGDEYLDLSGGGCILSISNGEDLIDYTVNGKINPLLKGVIARTNRGNVKGLVKDDRIVELTLIGSVLNNVKIHLELADDVRLLSHDGQLDINIDFTQEEPVHIVLEDIRTKMQKGYTITARTEKDLAPKGEGWTLVEDASELQKNLPDYAYLYKNEKLLGIPGNTGYVITIPAGMIDMKIAYEVNHSEWNYLRGTKFPADIVRENGGYKLFVAGTDVYAWKPQIWSNIINDFQLYTYQWGMTPNGHYHWSTDVYYYTCPPTLGVSNGKAEISYAEILHGNLLYKFAEPMHNNKDKSKFVGTSLWNVQAAISGYALPLRNGVVVIASESVSDYEILAKKERNFPFRTGSITALTDTKGYGDKASHLCDAERMARNLVGVTAGGDLIVFITERYVSTGNNKLKDVVNYPSEGITLREAAVILKEECNCTDAMAFDQMQRAVVAVNVGGSARELTKTESWKSDYSGGLSTFMMFK